MVEVGSAGRRVEDTTMVHLEDGLVSLNGDGCWSGVDGSLELGNRTGWDVVVGCDSNLSLCLIHVAGAGAWGDIWVSRLELLFVGLKIGESMGLPSTLASVRGSVAVNNLLLREGEKVASGNEVGALNGTGGRESPA